jgi:CRISPR/Cas system endoribonuclease Cas6 (RAMP superfamily)
MAERVLTDSELRDRLVTEASDHVLTFDWLDVARTTLELYDDAVAVGPNAPAASRT